MSTEGTSGKGIIIVTPKEKRAQPYEGPFSWPQKAVEYFEWEHAYEIYAPDCHHPSHEREMSISERGMEDIENFLKEECIISKLEDEI